MVLIRAGGGSRIFFQDKISGGGGTSIRDLTVFLYFFLSNFKLFDRLLGKGWWYASSVKTIRSLECISYPYLASYVFWWDEFFNNSGNINFTLCINQIFFLNIFFIFLQTFLSIKSNFLSFEPWIFRVILHFFLSFWFLYIFRCWECWLLVIR